MNDNGNIYVLMNPSMENLVKIGKTTRDPNERAKELSSTTGVPTPFVVIYECFFESCSLAENYVHTYLESKGFRLSKNREFFEIPIKDAIDAVMKAREHFGEFTPQEINIVDEEGIFSSEQGDELLDNMNYEEKIIEPWEEMFEIAETHYYGFGDEIVDYEEAMDYYLKAIKLGSVESYCRIGLMYTFGEGVRENKGKAFKYFKEGAKKGHLDCYAEMAKLFGDDENLENAKKSWNRYFELTADKINYLHGESYICLVMENNLELKYIDKLLDVKEEMLEFLMWSNEKTDSEFLIDVNNKKISLINEYVVDPTDVNTDVENRESLEPKSFWKGLFG